MIGELLIRLDDLEDDEDDPDVLWATTEDGHIFRLEWQHGEWIESVTGAVCIDREVGVYLRLEFVEQFS